ncbi:hypothetical protein E2562_014209 [Oryza meyeriana var. granulata]|uniref:Uncharacterized protein n=1 Tax=Oryza meyeriana var. granulata TaxID=110450 RepID=A0A6G1BKR7_9ORYZ|nr:hypothetical protein E2562_014209 [Oryza meyeriana var. granulata]
MNNLLIKFIDFDLQVHELHRLYRIQKLLMRDLKRELKNQSNMSTSPNGFAEYSRAALDAMRSYEQCYGAAARRGAAVHHAAAAAAARAALNLDVVVPAVEYAQSPEEDAEETDEEEEAAELELTLAVGSGAATNAKKRYNRNEHSPGQSFSSSSTESDVLVTGVREWQAHGGPTADADAASPPYHHKRRPAAAFDVVQVDDGGVQAPPPPLLFHWLSLRMA